MIGLSLSGRRRLTLGLSYLYLAGLLALTFFPLVWMVSSAIKPIEDLFVIPPQWIPKHPTLTAVDSVLYGDHGRPSLFLDYFRNSLIVTVGTTMLALVFISAAGSVALARHGDVSVPHLVGTTLGLAGGAYVGARFTRRVRREVLRVAVVAVPFVAGAMLLFL